jgi:rare lipoprotein A
MLVKNLLLKKGSLFFIAFIIFNGCAKHSYTPPTINNPIYQKTKQKAKSYRSIHKYTMKPYQVFGKWYYPKVLPIGTKLKGISSWYGPDFHGKTSSSGEVYDMHKLTAAHKTLPMHTIVKVTNLKNKKSVTVRINDRGPFVKGRIIDLSYEAGKRIGLDKSGIAPVVVEVLKYDKFIKSTIKPLKKKIPFIKAKKPKQKTKKIKSSKIAVVLGEYKSFKEAKDIKSASKFLYPHFTPLIIHNDKIFKVVLVGFKNKKEAQSFIQKNYLEEAKIKELK